jgi:site-specific DNA recombinase
VARRCRLRGSPALLTGRLFDERGNRMSPSHTNKGGVRYRYYVSQRVLQKKPQVAGPVSRVPAAEIEALVVTALRKHLQASGADAQSTLEADRELIERNIERVVLTPKHIRLQLVLDAPDAIGPNKIAGANAAGDSRSASITLPWTCPGPGAVKGIVHVPAHNTPMEPSRRDRLLTAIAKAREWVDEVAQGRTATFAQIARREGKVERHVRLLVTLAFLSPRMVAAIIDGTAPGDLTLTALARALPYSWDEQECRYLHGTHDPLPPISTASDLFAQR